MKGIFAVASSCSFAFGSTGTPRVHALTRWPSPPKTS